MCVQMCRNRNTHPGQIAERALPSLRLLARRAYWMRSARTKRQCRCPAWSQQRQRRCRCPASESSRRELEKRLVLGRRCRNEVAMMKRTVVVHLSSVGANMVH